MILLWLVVLFFSLMPSTWAVWVVQDKATGKLIEFQDSDRADKTQMKAALLLNAQRAGIDPATVDIREVSEVEGKAIIKQWVEDPAKAEQEAKKLKRKASEDAIKSKLGLSVQDFKDLKDALGR